MKYLNMALKAWRDGEELRRRRRRYKDYTYGRQWEDRPESDCGSRGATEGELAERAGYRPHTNNLIRQLVKCVVGNFRSALAQEGPEEGAPDKEVARRNSLDELDCRMLEEFLISGCAVQRVVAECRSMGSGVWVDNVSPDTFFVNRFTDPRGLDIELVGMLHSLSPGEVLMRFGGNQARDSELARRYADEMRRGELGSLGDAVSRNFLTAAEGRCRVIELWTLERRSVLRCHDEGSGDYFLMPAASLAEVSAEQERRDVCGDAPLHVRSASTLRWHCRFLAPWGEVLEEYDSPYGHGGHPFVVKYYPLIDGEVHSLVEDIVGQQRSINRILTLIDHMLSVSAKGALLLPVDALAPGMSSEDVGKLWARCDSVIPYRPGKGDIRQVSSGGESAGAYKLLETQMDMFHRVSGVSDALQGRVIDSGRASAALYDAQVQHSTVAILDLLETFRAFRRSRNTLVNFC